MRAVLASLMLSCAVARAAQAPVAFPQTYVGMVGRALKADPFYGSMLLAELDGRLTATAMLKTPVEVKSSLEGAAGPPAELKAQLASGAVPAGPSAALLVANALARPEQFREILSRLENVKPGLGRRIAEFMARTDGSGDKRLISALRLAGSAKVQPAYGIYDKNGNLEALFDGAGSSFASSVKEPTPVPAQDYKPGPSRTAGLLPHPDKRR